MLGISESGAAAAAGPAGPLANAGPDKANAAIFPEQPRGNVSTRDEAELLN